MGASIALPQRWSAKALLLLGLWELDLDQMITGLVLPAIGRDLGVDLHH